ncbi:flagellar protein FliT [Oceanobacillus halotolerans]|uniref:flagellar protein FliT n=1 Tax=Oceanobacillus halotolerans TaxID=2663380 RepID=UPI0013D9478B|nr:flagellar protein FliT [Oceanobacillus halotolerans]
MNPAITQLYDITKELDKVLNTSTSKNREEIITEVNRLIEERAVYLDELNPPFTEEEKTTGNQIVDLNENIKQKMDTLFADLKQEMKQMKQQKKSNQSYTNPYKHVQTMDGMFYDRKK